MIVDLVRNDLGAGRRARLGPGAGAAARRAALRGLAPGQHRHRAAARPAHRRRPARRHLPAGLGHRRAEVVGRAGHRRSSRPAPAASTPARSARQPTGRPGTQRRHPHARHHARPGAARGRGRHHRRLRARGRMARVPGQGRPARRRAAPAVAADDVDHAPPRPHEVGSLRDACSCSTARPVDLDAHLDRLARSADALWDAALPPGLRRRRAGGRRGPPMSPACVSTCTCSDGRLVPALRTGAADPPRPPADQAGLDLPHVLIHPALGRHKWSDRRRVDAWERAHDGRAVLLVDRTDGAVLETTRGNVLASSTTGW